MINAPRTLAMLLSIGAIALHPTAASAQPSSQGETTVSANTAPRLETFVDGAVAQQILSRDVGGGVVTVVQDGKVLFSRGYGFRDADRTLPFDGSDTLVRPGSISKMFTWIALLQQVEQGKVDLDAPVSQYIDFEVPSFGERPVRVRDLLSHNPGLSDVGDFIKPTLEELEPYADWLKSHVPRAEWEPGTEIAYSNYGASLAGYIVERVSSEPFADYVDRHIFRPLGMNDTTFLEPVPTAMQARTAAGYKLEEGRLVGQPPEYLSSIMPAGSATTSGPDMARFMLAMTDRSDNGAGRILTPAGYDLLMRDSLANAPDLPGMAHGFLVYREAGPRLVGHAGKTRGFSSDMIIAPGGGTGFFISMTGGTDSGKARTELSNLLTGQLFPQSPSPRWTGEAAAPPLGTYRGNRRDFTEEPNPEGDVKVAMPSEHRLLIETRGITTAWDQIGPAMFEKVTGVTEGGPYDRVQFYRTDGGARMAYASQPYMTYHFVDQQ